MGDSTVNVRLNSLKAWVLASRPKTLTAAAVPVMLGASMAWKTGADSFSWLSATLCMLFAFVMQIDANFVNDYFDCVRGNDDETRLGPKRACAMGWVSLPAMRIALAITTAIGCAVGLPLAFIGGWEMIMVGIACVVFCFLYTTTLSYLGLGDVLVLVFFGIVPVCCTYYLCTPVATFEQMLPVFVVSIACGLVIDTLLIINNYRDIDNDRRAGKKTLAVLIGRRNMRLTYLAIVPVALVLMLSVIPETIYIAVAIIVGNIHITTYSKMKKIGQGRELNSVLGMTARNIFLFGLLSSIAIILG